MIDYKIMKKIITICLIIFGFTSFAQKIKDHWVKFDYIRLPYKPLDKRIKSYTSSLISWETAQASVMQEQFEKELQVYRENYKIAHDKYKKELEEYNRKTRLEKIIDKELLEENKPVFTPPPYPELEKLPHPPNYEYLTSKYLSLDGYEKGNYSPVFITVELKECDIQETTSKTKTTGEGEKQKTVTTYYTKYKQPVKLTIESVVNGILYDDILPISVEYYTHSSSSKQSKEEIKDFAVNDLLAYTSKYINSNYGKSKKSLNTSVVLITKYKKYKYSEFEDALFYALSGYKNVHLNPEKSISSFTKAITIWEKVLHEYDPNNKKARVNREVAWYTMLNIAEAYLWMNNFDKADEYFSRMEVVQPKWIKARLKESKNRLKEHQERFLANGL